MNYAAKNIILIYQQSPNKLKEINNKIMEEIIERALKFLKKRNIQD